MTISKELQVLTSVLVARSNLAAKMGMSYSNERDLYQALGYPQELLHSDYMSRYIRHDIAKAIIDRPIKATWRSGFDLVESDDDTETALEKEFKALSKRLKVVSIFSRLDKLSHLGKYGVLLMGYDDVMNITDFEKPVNGGKRGLLYLRPFSEGTAPVHKWVEDTRNERYGLPEFYQLQVASPGGGTTTSSVIVHHSRVIHVADEKLESEVDGTPYMECVYNRLIDLEKLVGGSAEMFWRGARPGYHGKVDPDFTMTADTKSDTLEQIDEYEHNLRRILINQGIDMKALEQQVADPAQHVDVQIQMISAVTGIPKRILTGSERGELSSSQDRDAWLALIGGRRDEFADPCIIRPFVDSCILNGVLPEAKDEYDVQWPELFDESESDKAKTGQIRASALQSYAANHEAQLIVPPEAFFEYFLGFDSNQIEIITEMAAAAIEEEEAALEEQELAMKKLDMTPEQLDQVQHPEKYISGKKIINQPGSNDPVVQEDVDLYAKGNWGHAGRPGKEGGSAPGKKRSQMTAEEKKADIARTTAEKWARLKEFQKDLGGIMSKVKKDFNTSDEAKVLTLIHQTGFRVGGTRVRGEKEVYGASTMQAQHVSVSGSKMAFNFLGKKAINQSHIVDNADLASVISKRLSAAKSPTDRIFKTSDTKIRNYLKEISGKDYLVKDFRTHVATSNAALIVSKLTIPKTSKEIGKKKMEVATAVSKMLGNTPAMALGAYINPVVFSQWEAR